MYTINEENPNSLLVGSLIVKDQIYQIYWSPSGYATKLSFFTVEALLRYLQNYC